MTRNHTHLRLRRIVAAGAVASLALAACGGDDDTSDGGEPAAAEGGADNASEPAPDPANEPAAEPADGGGGGGSGGTLVIGDETIQLDRARCFLQEQDAAAGGGKILFVAQAFGTTAEGDELIIDVSRYDEDSQFVGDDIIVDIGDPFSDEAVSLSAGGDIGTVTVDGQNVSADNLTFTNFDTFEDLAGSFFIDC